MKLVSIGVLAKKIGVQTNILRTWEKEGKIQAHRTMGGHRRYDLDSVLRLLNRDIKATTIIFINTQDEKEMEQLMSTTKIYCDINKWSFILVKDSSSPLSCNSENFLEMLNIILNKDIERVVIPYKTMLGTISKYSVLESICKEQNIHINYIDSNIRGFTLKDFEVTLNLLEPISSYLKLNKIRHFIKDIKEELYDDEK